MYTKLAADFLFPLHERVKRHSTIAVFREMERTQWLSADAIQKLQLARLRTFLVSIGRHVPYYRDMFSDLGFAPERLHCLADLHQLPITGKPEIRSNSDLIKSELAGDLSRFSTSGSSGEPLVFYLGKKRISHDVAAKRRATRWWNVDIGDPEIVVWGSPVELGAQDRLRSIRDLAFRTQLLSSHNLSDEELGRFLREIKTRRPKMLFGYPSALARIAEYAISCGDILDNLGIKVAFVTAEQMTDIQRKAIETVFGCPTANGYGGRDAGFIAHQCPEGSMHITAEDIVVEIVDEHRKVLPVGEIGEIVVTHLASDDFPFLRYPTGDLGALDAGACPCGRGLPLLREISGRTNDFVVGQNGRLIHQTALNYIMRDMPGLKAFKVIQYDLLNITLQLVRGLEYDPVNESRIRKVYRETLGEGVAIKIEYCSEIQPEASGKLRYVVSHVART